MATILVVEDSKDYQKIFSVVLEGQHQLHFYENADSIVEHALDCRADLILLDILLSSGNGFEAARLLQSSPQTSDIPIIFVTGKRCSDDLIQGLSLGAEDYITKPFEPVEFKARIEARIKKTQELRARDRVLRAGNLLLHTVDRRAYLLSEDGKKEIEFSPSEFLLLSLFLQNCGKNITRDEISSYLFRGKKSLAKTRRIDAHICAIRKKAPELSKKIQPVYGVGYRFGEHFPQRQ